MYITNKGSVFSRRDQGSVGIFSFTLLYEKHQSSRRKLSKVIGSVEAPEKKCRRQDEPEHFIRVN
jgi:hypothetical protein